MTVRNIKKNLAGAEDLLHGIGTESQARGGSLYEMHKLDTYVPTYSVVEMQRSSLTFMRLYGDDTNYTDYRRNPSGTVGIPSEVEGVWEPIPSDKAQVVGNFLYGAYVYAVGQVVAYNNDFYAWNGAIPHIVPAASSPATAGGVGVGAWSDKTDLTLRSDLSKGALLVRSGLWSLRDFVSVKDFGAVGDGITDDTDALTLAHNSEYKIYYPEGTYLITNPIPLKSFHRIIGEPSESYIDWANDYQQQSPSYAGKASVIQYKSGYHGQIFSGSASGVSITGMTFRVGQVRTQSDTLMSGMGGLGTFENCKFENIDTVFVDPIVAYGAGKLLSNRFFANGTIADGAFVDTIIANNIFTSNAQCFSPKSGGGFFQIVGNRFEFNTSCIAAFETRSGIITGNLFDCSYSSAISFYNSNGWEISGNKFNGNGMSAKISGSCSHIHIKGSTSGLTICGNEFSSERSDSSLHVTKHILEIESATGAGNNFSNNSDIFGWIDTPFLNTYTTNPVIKIDSITIPVGIGTPNTATDQLFHYLNHINSISIGDVNVYVSESRLINEYCSLKKIMLIGVGETAIHISNSNGNAAFSGMDNINYGGCIYSFKNGVQKATAQPNIWGSNSNWEVGSVIFDLTPISGGYIGWTKISSGSPDVWKSFGSIL